MSDRSESRTTIWFAVAANLAIALLKSAAALLTGSSAMFAEAAHAFADTGNGSILLVAERRGDRPPDDEHPLGHGAEAYFWAFLASVGVFVTGGVLSIVEGVRGLTGHSDIRSFPIAYAVLGLSLIFESVSLWRVHRQLSEEAARLQRDLLDHVSATSDPVTRAIFAEDGVAVAGTVVALVGVSLHQVTGSPIPDGCAAIVIGVGLTVVAFALSARNRRFLLGEPAPSELRDRLDGELRRLDGIERVEEMVVTFVGPRRVRVLASVDIDDRLTGGEVEELVREAERVLHGASDTVTRVDVVPRGTRAGVW
jgi:cation diffusion facilitator family transporter